MTISLLQTVPRTGKEQDSWRLGDLGTERSTLRKHTLAQGDREGRWLLQALEVYNIHIILLVPFLGVQKNHGQESLEDGNTIDLGTE